MTKKLTGREAGIALLQGRIITDGKYYYRADSLGNIERYVLIYKGFEEDLDYVDTNGYTFISILLRKGWELYEPEEEKKDLQVNVKVLDIPEVKNILDKSAQDLQAQQDTIDKLEQEVKDKISYALSLEEKIIELEAKNKNLKAQNFLLELMFATPEEVARQKESWEEVKKTLGLGE